jgi:hypothetical protein
VTSGRAGVHIATLTIASSATTETTWSYTGTADQVYAAVGVFTKVVEGTPPQEIRPDADVTTTGWTTTPLHSKVSDESDATNITATAA